ncbi:MAG: RagB/SusD family nutrient uptake outer membrane protein [Cytophagales bacterium]|nr:RagB/SusD family nutrient uptake outer membrane protein [Cytophagales bacterium]MDW8383580.1 RagB/SusD family nutrient uptake outer membrane protein [Flammeovirgaceae bacterium]
MQYTQKYFTLLSVGMLLVATSCERIVDTKPTDQVDIDDVFRTADGVEAALTGCYSNLRSRGFHFETVILGELAADNATGDPSLERGQYFTISQNAYDPTTAVVRSIWETSYSAINSINIILDRLATSGATAADRPRIEAELRFLRAFHYFNLVKCFGGVPLRTKGNVELDATKSAQNTPRSTADQVYNFIISELQAALPNVPRGKGNAYFRASEGAVRALLARVALYAKNYPLAIEQASILIDSARFGYKLLPNYTAIFREKRNEEVIFAVEFNAGAPNSIGRFTSGAGTNVIRTTPVLNAYTTADSVRKSIAVTKYATPNGVDDVIMLRLAEMYLIRAEALAQSNGSRTQIVADINKIKQRAGVPLLTSTTLSYAEYLAEIEKERRLEFSFEGHRFFDLVRTNRAVDVLSSKPSGFESFKQLLPIPTSEMLFNSAMVQNPGY